MCADDCSIRPQHGPQLRRKLRQAVCLHSKKDNVHWPNFFEGTGDFRPRDKISLAASHLHATFLHGTKMRTAREERDIEPGMGHARTDVGTDCSGPRDQETHS